jgi:hypothetical protein
MLNADLKVDAFLRLWCGRFSLYLYDMPQLQEDEEECTRNITDLQLAILLHFVSIHGGCMRIDAS